MLNEIKLAHRVKNSAYDAELMRLAVQGMNDLVLAGINCSGVSYTVSAQGVVTDTSTITDQLLIGAVITYTRYNFGSPADYDKLKASYDEQKAQLQSAEAYRRNPLGAIACGQ